MNELKPCPLCGSVANLSWNNRYGYVPWCDNEDCILNESEKGYGTEQEAIEAWNRRTEEGEHETD